MFRFQVSKPLRRARSLAVALSVLWAADAGAFSLRIHMLSGKRLADELTKTQRDGSRCRIPVGGWNKLAPGGFNLRADVPGGNLSQMKNGEVIDLSGEVCTFITSAATRQYFISGTVAPDVFPGLFENTDPTHALYWNTSWQIEVLWQNASTPEEKAFVLGWIVHFAGDMNAHGLANLHAGGVWGADQPGSPPLTEWRHTFVEVYYAARLFKFPAGFDNRLVYPESFVKRMFFNPESPIYKHYDYLYNALPIGATARRTHALFRALFLAWDFAAEKKRMFEGREQFHRARAASNLRTVKFIDWLAWAFASYAKEWHAVKARRAKEAIDRWYTATVRDAQAKVADGTCVFKGDGKYPAAEYSTQMSNDLRAFYAAIKSGLPEGRWKTDEPPSDGKYRQGGAGGEIDAYRYLVEGVVNLFYPDFVTPALEQNSAVATMFEDLRRMGAAGQAIIQAIKDIKADFEYRVNTPVRIVKEGLHGLFKSALTSMSQALFLDDVIARIGTWGISKLPSFVGNALKPLERAVASIEAQGTAFGISREREDYWLKWPIFRNTVTAAALMMRTMRGRGRIRRGALDVEPWRILAQAGMSKAASGTAAGVVADGALTLTAAAPQYAMKGEEQSPTFGVASGDFGCSQTCTSAYRLSTSLFMPDSGNYYRDLRIKAALNDHCMVRHNEARRSDAATNAAAAGLTNDQANKSSYNDQTPFTCFVATTAWNRRCKEIPNAGANAGVYDLPRIPDVRTGASTLNAPFLNALVPFFERAPTGWQYTRHAIPRVRNVYVMPQSLGKPGGPCAAGAAGASCREGSAVVDRNNGTPVESGGERIPVCYRALGVDARTIAPAVPDPLARAVRPSDVKALDLSDFSSVDPTRIGEIVGKTIAGIGRWARETARQACRDVEEKVRQTVEQVLKSAVGLLCDAKCRAAALESTTCTECALGVCVSVPCVRFNEGSFNACVENQCQCIPGQECDCILGARSNCLSGTTFVRRVCPNP